MGRKRRNENKKKPARPERVIQTRGILTFDSLLCCDHRWRWLEQEDPLRRQYERVCETCGAGSTLNDRKKVVAYDRDWNHGNPRPVPEDVREAERRPSSPETGMANEPVTWGDGAYEAQV